MANTSPTPDLQQHRGYLYRYALLQLRDADRAEDVVQETLLAAIEGGERFSGKSSLRTWLTGILKHKVIDQIRRQSRERPTDSVDDLRSELDCTDIDDMFEPDGHWREMPQSWADPARALENKRFWEVFELCSAAMPANTARVFMMREVMGMETEEICKEMGITPTNCWVLLHRARINLRKCLEKNWFGGASRA